MSREPLVTPCGRVSYPFVFNPYEPDQGEAAYKLTLIFYDEDGADLSKLKAAANAAVKARWGDKVPSNLYNPFRSTSEYSDKDGYQKPGTFISFKRRADKGPPAVRNLRNEPILSPEEFYAGCYAHCLVTCYAFDNVTKGVSFGLTAIQKLGEGEPLGELRADDVFFDLSGGVTDATGQTFNDEVEIPF